jgi:putative pyrroloquinoline-quinone binding quinoprotein
VNNEERRLADILHRITPEPSRPVTVEQVAYRLVSEPRPGRQPRGRQPGSRVPRPRRGGLGLSRAWAPALAAAAVVVIAGASAGIAVLANSHHTPPSAAGGPASSASSSSSAPTQTSSSTEQTTPATAVGGAPWGAKLIGHEELLQGSLVSADGSLYAIGNTSTLDRIDPATGAVVASVPSNMPVLNPPVVVGNTVWMVSSYNGGNIVLQGYDARTLARTSSIPVPAIGGVGLGGQGVLTSGPDGNLYVAAGEMVQVVNPASGQEVHQVQVLAGRASSVAVSPDGSKLYVGISAQVSSTPFRLVVFNLPSDTIASQTALTSGGDGGNLVATSGGVWGTTGSGHSEWVWFAPNGNLARAVQVGQGGGGGLDSFPSYSGGVVWVGGTGDVVCADPATGQVRAKAGIPADHGVAQYFASPVISGGQAYSSYQTDASQQTGLARMTPPAACSGVNS